MDKNSNGMEPINQMQSQAVSQAKPKTSAKDFFLNLGAIVALYTVVFNLVNLLFTVINKAYPQVSSGYYGLTSYSISFPVATLIIFFPIFVLLMWVLAKGYVSEPEKKHLSVRKWLTYITLFIAGLALAGDLVTVLYYFLDGQELTTGFLLKVLVVLVLAGLIFYYYLSDIREKLTAKSQKIWLLISFFVILISIIWGFSVLGSPRTQQLARYDEQKVNNLMEISNQVSSYWQMKKALPVVLSDLTIENTYYAVPIDPQSNQPYGYQKIDAKSYKVCATFNTATNVQTDTRQTYPVGVWVHPAGEYCFTQTVIDSGNPKSVPVY